MAIKKHLYKLALGVDILDENVLKTFSTESLKAFISLIDTKNIKNSNDNQYKEKVDKSNLINQLIRDLGFKNIFDTKTITREQLKTNIEYITKNNVLFTNQLNTKVRFNLSKTKKINSTNGFLGFVNSLLSSYHIKLSSKKVTVNYINSYIYKIEITDDINELLQYKIDSGFFLEDSKNMRTIPTTQTYKHLLNPEIITRVFTCKCCKIIQTCECNTPLKELYKTDDKYMCLNCVFCYDCR
jgi:hypothetical protein